ncbi:heme peroxidase [Mycena albidolilacea]|uniref:Heme peroxidase n=1 Tax=Mycena albidolilacea TaxID=1033008 RepID=A0AAD7ELR9_9AGAR|nr:heme peroxidase [Mycena albidolilacea]
MCDVLSAGRVGRSSRQFCELVGSPGSKNYLSVQAQLYITVPGLLHHLVAELTVAIFRLAAVGLKDEQRNTLPLISKSRLKFLSVRRGSEKGEERTEWGRVPLQSSALPTYGTFKVHFKVASELRQEQERAVRIRMINQGECRAPGIWATYIKFPGSHSQSGYVPLVPGNSASSILGDPFNRLRTQNKSEICIRTLISGTPVQPASERFYGVQVRDPALPLIHRHKVWPEAFNGHVSDYYLHIRVVSSPALCNPIEITFIHNNKKIFKWIHTLILRQSFAPAVQGYVGAIAAYVETIPGGAGKDDHKHVLAFLAQGANGLQEHDIFQQLFKKIMTFNGQTLVQNLNSMRTGDPKSSVVKQETFGRDRLVGMLYEKMPHPPKNLTGIEFRSADGSDGLGKTGSVYARSALPHVPPSSGYPPAHEVFKQLLQREEQDGIEKIKDSTLKLSSLTFAFGTLVIHSVFHSDMKDPKINQTSSYFDLAPLYGDDEQEQNQIRNKTGRGLLHPDCFVDERLLFLPPAAAALLVLFNRNHNAIAAELLKHEKDTRGWSDPPPVEDAEKRDAQDEQIFQTARLINCAHFVNIVITDYVGGIMGCTKWGGGWPFNAEAFGEIIQPDMNVGRGEGNLVSIEFNTLYRWHATLSPADVEWAKGLMGKQINNKKPENVDWNNLTPADYERAARSVLTLAEPKDRTFAGLRRTDGKFKDAELAELIYNATEAPAGEFRARGTPGAYPALAVMAFIDIRGIERARAMRTCTLNQFRKWLGLPPYTTFYEWNADKAIAEAASRLYNGKIDDLELYPGLHAEGHKDDGFPHSETEYNKVRVNTMRNGLLLDAIALIRGDRFFTTAFTADARTSEENYTKWGYADAQRGQANKAYGGQIHKLLFRTLKDHFPQNSVYSWFPMTLPGAMEGTLGRQGANLKDWDFKKPKVGHAIAKWNCQQCRAILNHPFPHADQNYWVLSESGQKAETVYFELLGTASDVGLATQITVGTSNSKIQAVIPVAPSVLADGIMDVLGYVRRGTGTQSSVPLLAVQSD